MRTIQPQPPSGAGRLPSSSRMISFFGLDFLTVSSSAVILLLFSFPIQYICVGKKEKKATKLTIYLKNRFKGAFLVILFSSFLTQQKKEDSFRVDLMCLKNKIICCNHQNQKSLYSNITIKRLKILFEFLCFYNDFPNSKSGY